MWYVSSLRSEKWTPFPVQHEKSLGMSCCFQYVFGIFSLNGFPLFGFHTFSFCFTCGSICFHLYFVGFLPSLYTF